MELPHIGEACMVCHRNDYLPFKCTHCDKIVCVDHKTNHGSECPLTRINFVANSRDHSTTIESIKQACNFCHKVTLKVELTLCEHCAACHCLYHRHQVQHNCPQLASQAEEHKKEREAKAARQNEALSMLANLKSTSTTSCNKHVSGGTSQTVCRDLKKNALAKRVRIMKIKQTARGLPNIPDQDKIYFEIKFMHNPNCALSNKSNDGKTLRIYATLNQTIGRMVDWLSDKMDITNKNHVAGASKLVIMSKANQQTGQVVLDSNLTFKHHIESNEIEDGDELILTHLDSC